MQEAAAAAGCVGRPARRGEERNLDGGGRQILSSLREAGGAEREQPADRGAWGYGCTSALKGLLETFAG